MPRERPTRSFLVGKVPPDILARIVYPRIGKRNPRLLLGPGIGRDTAVVKQDHGVLVFTSDPITGTSRHIGEHSVLINANDIATTGATPVWYLCTILLPPGTSEKELGQIMRGVDLASKELGIAVVGGHTEATRGLERPIVAGFMVGETKGRVLGSHGGRVGDHVLLTKTAGLEGTAILASDYEARLKRIPEEILARARNFSRRISLVREALTIAKIPGVHAMHDPTEGGVLNGFWELAEASGLGIEVWEDRIPVAEETREICSVLRLDPLKLMSSGCLLAAVQPSAVTKVTRLLGKLRVRVSEVGKLAAKAEGRYLIQGSRKREIVAVPQDALYGLG